MLGFNLVGQHCELPPEYLLKTKKIVASNYDCNNKPDSKATQTWHRKPSFGGCLNDKALLKNLLTTTLTFFAHSNLIYLSA